MLTPRVVETHRLSPYHAQLPVKVTMPGLVRASLIAAPAPKR
jgi:hypothetical protein